MQAYCCVVSKQPMTLCAPMTMQHSSSAAPHTQHHSQPANTALEMKQTHKCTEKLQKAQGGPSLLTLSSTPTLQGWNKK